MVVFATINASRAAVSDLNTALQNTYRACVGIDESLSDLKKLAGINTALGVIGAVTTTSGTIVGALKAKTDSKAKSLEQLIKEIQDYQKSTPNVSDFDMKQFEVEFEMAFTDAEKNVKTHKSELEQLNEKSKKLGNWRTGLVATGAATNIAGAIISVKNKSNTIGLERMVKNCLDATDVLSKQISQARINGDDVNEAQQIYYACREYSTVDLNKLLNQNKGAMIASVVAGSAGVAGTITSVASNTDSVRGGDDAKEKNLNTASNVLAGTTAVASGVAVAFSASQIAAVKRIVSIAEKCEGVLNP